VHAFSAFTYLSISILTIRFYVEVIVRVFIVVTSIETATGGRRGAVDRSPVYRRRWRAIINGRSPVRRRRRRAIINGRSPVRRRRRRAINGRSHVRSRCRRWKFVCNDIHSSSRAVACSSVLGTSVRRLAVFVHIMHILDLLSTGDL
jgi:hypothetical protein